MIYWVFLISILNANINKEIILRVYYRVPYPTLLNLVINLLHLSLNQREPSPI